MTNQEKLARCMVANEQNRANFRALWVQQTPEIKQEMLRISQEPQSDPVKYTIYKMAEMYIGRLMEQDLREHLEAEGE